MIECDQHAGAQVSRRAALAALPMLAVASCATGGAAGGATNVMTGALRDYVKMRAALDDRLVIGFLTGRYYGIVDADVTPFFGLEAATFSRFAPMADGGVRACTFEIAYFTDLASGAAIENWRNPYTGETVSVPVTKTEPTIFFIRPDLRIELARAIPGTTLSHSVSKARVSGDDVWDDRRAVCGRRRLCIGQAISIWRNGDVPCEPCGSRQSAPCARALPHKLCLRRVVAAMATHGERAGTLSGRGEGRTGVSMDQLPEVWRNQTSARFPALFADPLTPLNAALAASIQG